MIAAGGAPMNPTLSASSARAARSARAVQSQALGARGEALAAAYLAEHGYEILERNWRGRRGELDLIVRTAHTLVAVEVKTRRGTGYGTPLSAVTPQKVARLRLLLGEWLSGSGEVSARLRIDVIGMLLRADAGPRLEHLRGVA